MDYSQLKESREYKMDPVASNSFIIKCFIQSFSVDEKYLYVKFTLPKSKSKELSLHSESVPFASATYVALVIFPASYQHV